MSITGSEQPNKASEFRKKKKANTLLYKLCAVILVAVGLLVIWFNADSIFAPFKNIAAASETEGGGFPVRLPGSASYSFDEFGTSFTLLTDTYLYTYSTGGNQIFSHQHGYTNPIQVSNDRRILLYDKNSFEFSLYNKNSCLFENTVDDKIVYAALSDSDYSAIVTTSSRYSNVLYVYDGSGNWKYIRKFVDENVMQAAFTKDLSAIIVSTVGVSEGDIVTKLYKFSLTSDEAALWSYTVYSNTMTLGLHVTDKAVLAVGNNIFLSVDLETGLLNKNYTFTHTLLNMDMSDSFSVLLLHDLSKNEGILATLTENGELINTRVIDLGAVSLKISEDMVYLLGGGKITAYPPDLSAEKVTDLGEEYSDFIKIGEKAYLLGYDEVAEAQIN